MLRAPSDDLIALFGAVADDATAWDFFALLRCVEQASPRAPRIGTALDPADETVDLAQEPSLAFPRSTVAGFDPDRRRPRIRSQHFGLVGPMGPMPLHMTEMAMAERTAGGPNPLGDMLDMLGARMAQAFYRAWASANPCAQADRPADDAFAGYIGAISGGTSLRFVSGAERPGHDEPGFGDWRRLAYGGHLAGLRSAAAVADLLGHALDRPVRVDETVGRWRDVPGEARSRIGRRGAHQQLGTGATLGGRFFAVEWDVALRVRVRSMDDLERLLPGGEAHGLLIEAADAVLPQHIDWHARIEIDEAAIAPARIGTARLGMTTWIAPRGRGHVRGDVRLSRRTGTDNDIKGMTA